MGVYKENKTFNFISAGNGLEDWIRSFALYVKATPEENVIIYPDSLATGSAGVFCIEDGLSYRIVDYRANSDCVFIREAADQFYLVIYFYQYSDCEKLSVTINNEVVIESEEKNYSTLLMTNSLLSQKLTIAKGTYVRGLTIELSEDWLMEKIARPHTVNYALFKEKDVFQSFLTPKAQKLLTEIFTKRADAAAPNLYTNNRVLRLLEAFLENILKNGISPNTLPASLKDVQNILKVESILLENYNSEFPSIGNLAREALMSQTKLKNVFKKAFGMGMYEYYQKNRMHKAKQLLDTGKYSVSEVGVLLGYQNLSNFSNSFKKEFHHLPKDCQKIG